MGNPPPGPLADAIDEEGQQFESELAASAVGRPVAGVGVADFATPAAVATIVRPLSRGLPSTLSGGGDAILRPLVTSAGSESCEDVLWPRGWKRRPESS